jgi:hypothetical protein
LSYEKLVHAVCTEADRHLATSSAIETYNEREVDTYNRLDNPRVLRVVGVIVPRLSARYSPEHERHCGTYSEHAEPEHGQSSAPYTRGSQEYTRAVKFTHGEGESAWRE